MSETQTTLPFPEWRISPRWGTLLGIVNTWAAWLGGYDSAQWHIYRLKDRILKRHGVPDGTDLQIITLTCNCCHGRGHFGPPWNRDFCRKCVGSGVFARDYITLSRFRIGAHVFHVPNRDSRFRVPDEQHETHWRPTGEGHVSVIHGRVSHPNTQHHAWRWVALFLLTLRFAPTRGRRICGLYVFEQRRALNAWWCWGAGAVWRYRVREALSGRPVNWGKSANEATADEVPF
jgi:hypothetical protein